MSVEAAKEGDVAGRMVWKDCEFRKDRDVGCKLLEEIQSQSQSRQLPTLGPSNGHDSPLDTHVAVCNLNAPNRKSAEFCPSLTPSR